VDTGVVRQLLNASAQLSAAAANLGRLGRWKWWRSGQSTGEVAMKRLHFVDITCIGNSSWCRTDLTTSHSLQNKGISKGHSVLQTSASNI
jgi:hypothetical protein